MNHASNIRVFIDMLFLCTVIFTQIPHCQARMGVEGDVKLLRVNDNAGENSDYLNCSEVMKFEMRR